jgi:hypothetical protein
VTPSSFKIRYAGPIKPLLMALGMGPAQSGIEVTPNELRVQMGWAFHAKIPTHNIRHIEQSARPILLGWGVHGWAGRWLVNGSGKGIVRIEIDPAARARVMGIPVRLTTLLVSASAPKNLVNTINRIRVA